MKLRQSLIDSIEGFYLAFILDFLHREGILRELERSEAVASIAASRRIDRDILTSLLEYVANRSELVDRVGTGTEARFAVAESYRESALPAHLLDQYVGGFGPCLVDLAVGLRSAERARSKVDSARHAAAYAGDGGTPRQFVQLVQELEIGTLLDVGCGGGQLLTDLARDQPRFRGIGLDENPEAVKVARRTVEREGLSDRIEIFHGDIFEAGTCLSEARRRQVDALTAVGVANAFFSKTPGRRIDDFFSTLRRWFPARVLILCDYYSRLGSRIEPGDECKRTLIHDIAQLVSGQGLPPDSLMAWRRVYKRASCRLVEAFERSDDGINWFIHIVQL